MVASSTRTITIGTRTSELARWQTDHVIEQLQRAWPELKCETRTFVTAGDKEIDKPLPEIGGKGLFTAELEEALRNGEIDLAVHSLKDLPVQNAPGLTVGAVIGRADVADGLVAAEGQSLTSLSPGAIVGTSSLRRQAQLLAVRPDLRVESIRGNVGTRVRKVHGGEYDAAVLAAAGLQRLGLEGSVADWLTLDVMLPAPGQGALAVQCRASDEATLAIVAAIDDRDVRRATTAERHFLQALGGGCSAPIAAYARPGDGETLTIEGMVADPDGSRIIRVSGSGSDPQLLAETLAAEAIDRGARAILEELAQPTDSPAAVPPLHGRKIIVTRPRAQARTLADRLAALGATPILFPTIRIAPVADTSRLDEAILSLARYDWVVFTSVNGVSVFWERMAALDKGIELFDGTHLAAIGPATGDALTEKGVNPDFIPEEFVAERIAEGLGDVGGRTILLPRAEQARATLADMLRAAGAEVDEIATYRTLPAVPEIKGMLPLQGADAITFTSSSTVRNFATLAGGPDEARRIAAGLCVACIGPITAGTAREMGMHTDVVAETYTVDGLVQALVEFYQGSTSRGQS